MMLVSHQMMLRGCCFLICFLVIYLGRTYYYYNCLFEKKSHRHGEDQEEVVVVKAKHANDPLCAASARNGVGDDSQPQRVNGTDICSSSI
jgi:hypothetical protein